MKQKLLFLVFAIMASLGNMSAWDYEHVLIGDLYYNLNASDLTAEVTFDDEYYSNYPGLTKAYISSTTTYNGQEYKITSIGDGAFKKSHLTYVLIGSNVTSIGWMAFESCSSLPSVYIPKNVTSIGARAFWGCSSLTSVTIPSSVTSIGNAAFYGCSSLTKVTIPNKVTSISAYTFHGCSSLTSVTIPNGVTSIGDYAFHYCCSLTSVTIPNSVTSIGDYAFHQCSGLTSLTIPNSVTEIGKYAFASCGLTSLTISNSVTSIGDFAFSSCKIISVTIPNSVTSVGEGVFSSCINLTSVVWNAKMTNDYSREINPFYEYTGTTIYHDIRKNIISFTFGDEVEKIPAYLCKGMTGLTSITIPANVTSIGERAFENCKNITSVVWNVRNSAFGDFGSSAYWNFGSQVESFTFGDEVEVIPGGLCLGMNKLTSIIIPNSVTSIGSSAFYNCSGLTSIICEAGNTVYDSRNNCNAIIETATNTIIVGCQNTTIPNSVTSIGEGAFYGCSGLTSITIGHSVTEIGDFAFYKCSGLTSVTIGSGLLSIGLNAFLDCGSLTTVILNSNAIVSKTYSSNSTIQSIFGEQVTEYILGDEITSIGKDAFYDCSGLTSVTIPNSVTSIGNSAFSGCPIGSINFTGTIEEWCNKSWSPSQISSGYQLLLNGVLEENVVIPNSVTSIGYEAFYYCSSLTSVTIGNSVTSIGYGAFDGCSSLTTVTMESTTPPGMSGAAFDKFDKNLPKIYVPCGSLDAYKTAYGWHSYYSKIQYVPAQYSITFFDSDYGQYDYAPPSVCDNELTAVPNEGYHFVSWADGNMDNPRTIKLTQDTVMEAIFAINTYNVTVTYNHDHGTVTGETGVFEHFSEITYEAIPNYGYHFSRWSDGKTANPRTITITGNTELTAIFEPNQYHISASCDQSQGSITGVGSYPYMSICSLEAVSNYGYHFSQWTDGVTDNPRSFILTQDTTFAAVFAVNQYSINVSCDNNMGSVIGENGTFDYLTERTYEAIPNYGYHFVRWSDGETANPRTITLVKDITLSAEFSINLYLVQFFGYEDVLLDQQSVEHGKSAIAPNAPTIENYDFIGWDKDFNNVQSDLDVFAQYVKTIDAIEDINADQATTQKVLIDDQLFIIRDDKVYTLQGTEVK